MRPLTPIDRAVSTYCGDWPRKKLGQPDVSKINPESLSESTSPKFSFRYIDISSVNEGTINWRSVNRIEFADAPSRARRVVRHGDTLICTVRPVLKSHAYASWQDNDPTICSTGFAVVRCQSKLLPPFFQHLVFSEQVIRQLIAWQCGTNYPAVNERDIHRLIVPIPPPDEQSAIARILNAVDAVLEKSRAAADRAFEVKRALMQHLFSAGTRRQGQKKTAIGPLPKSWKVVPVSSVVTSFQYGLSIAMSQKGTLPVLRMGNIQDGDVVLADLKFVNLSREHAAPYLVKRGDILFNRTNSQEWVGKVGIYRHDTNVVFASYLIRLIPDALEIDNYFLGHVLNSYSTQCRIKRYATPGVQQVNINATNLGKVLIPVPTGPHGLDEQREIAALLEAADNVARRYKLKVTALQVLKDSLMRDLLAGRARVLGTSEVAAA